MIINETAAKMMGFADPVGRIVMHGPDPKEIIGVVRDFKYGSLHTPIELVFFEYQSINPNIVVRLAPDSPQNTLGQLLACIKSIIRDTRSSSVTSTMTTTTL